MGLKRTPPELQCPRCDRGTLKIKGALDLPPDSRSDEITVQLIQCSRCDLRGLGVYEESRRGSEDAVDHRGWIITKETWHSLAAELENCPDPRNPRCRCSLHQQWGVTNEYGRWRGLADLRSGDWFHILIRR